jgi:hypothetical protein
MMNQPKTIAPMSMSGSPIPARNGCQNSQLNHRPQPTNRSV